MKQAIKIKENVYWVGVRDLNVRDFHGELYPVEEGATYNAYLVIDDQITLFDTVEEEFCGECIERIESVLDGRSIDNIIVQHAEPDHSGGFKRSTRNIQTQKSIRPKLVFAICRLNISKIHHSMN